VEVSVPDLGDFADVEIIEILVKAGDRVAAEDPIVTLETDKATMDVPAPAAGVVRGIKVAVGDRVSTGDALITLETDAEPKDAGPASASTAGARTGGAPAPATPSPPASAAAPATPRPPAPATPPPSASASEVEPSTDASGGAERPVNVPDLGDFSDVEVIEILVAEGDEVEAEQGLITLETDKATMDVPAPEAGTVAAIRVQVGDRVSAGDDIMVLRSRIATKGAPKASTGRGRGPEPEEVRSAAKGGDAWSSANGRNRSASEDGHRRETDGNGSVAEDAERGAAAGGSAAHKPTAAAAPRSRAVPIDIGGSIDEAAFARVHAGPSVRKLARELGVDLGRVRGSGRKGRITADDVKSFVKDVMRGGRPSEPAWPAVPQIDFAKFGAVEVKPLGRIQRISAARLHASWVNIPHVTQHDEADITGLEETRQSLKPEAEERGIKLTPLAFIVRACALMLAEFPRFKASLSADGENVVFKQYTHIGFAADTPNGLVVPVIRDADQKDVYEIARELGELSARARGGKLKADDIQGSVFTISSLGGIGGKFFTPIINAPEVAILGVSRSDWRPVYRDRELVPRLVLPLSLSYDHRVIDGADAVRFTTRLVETLGQVERLLEAVP
jgi:pyruvate dehydrogenase E2 component (dihydrolipoamide acetyltransferase)